MEEEYDISLPGAAVPIGRRSPPPPMVAWWKEQLETAGGRQPAQNSHRSRRRAPSDEYDSEGSLDSRADSQAELRGEVDELRDALRAARRQLDAGERRERALRRALRRADLPPVAREDGRGSSSAAAPAAAPPNRLPLGSGGMLDQALMQSGLLNTEEGRLEIAQLLARATSNQLPANLGLPGSRPPLPPAGFAPAMEPPREVAGASSSHRTNAARTLFHGPSAGPPLHAIPPLGLAASLPLGLIQPSAPGPPSSGGMPPSYPPSAPGSTPQASTPTSVAPPAAPFAPPAAPLYAASHAMVADTDVQRATDAMIDDVVGEELKALVKVSVRSLVASLLPNSKKSAKQAVETGGVYGHIYNAVLADVLNSEAASIVGDAVEAVASDYVLRRGAERIFQALVEEIMQDELGTLAADARVEVVADKLISAAMEPLIREVCVATLQEARGAAARNREQIERKQVANRAVEGLFERLCLQRFLQHIATSGEVLLLQVEAAQLLDKLIGDGLARHAFKVGETYAELQGSAVLHAAHQRIAYTALVDEFLAQLRVLSSSGLEAGVPDPPLETDTETEESGDEAKAAPIT